MVVKKVNGLTQAEVFKAMIYNFGAGPAMLPVEVMQRAQQEFLDWHGRGMSIMEMSHRSKDFVALAEKSEADLRQLLTIPNDYAVLFLQGGATSQFAMAPLNLLPGHDCADYVHTGYWSGKAIKEARRYGRVNIAASGEADAFMRIPSPSDWVLDPDAAYVFYTANETISGVEFSWVPDTGEVPLVADMTSNLLSRPLDVSRFGLIFAGAQKNFGPSGLVLAIIRKDLLGHAGEQTPGLYNYQNHVDGASMYNTPATYSWYIAALVFEWLLEVGGVTVMARRNREKAALLYQLIDASDFYTNPVHSDCRSDMNVTFKLIDERLEQAFLKGAEAHGLLSLKGHRSVGGMRASIYNAMPVEGVHVLVDYMIEFERSQA